MAENLVLEEQWQKAKIPLLKEKNIQMATKQGITFEAEPENQLHGDFTNRDDMEKGSKLQQYIGIC